MRIDDETRQRVEDRYRDARWEITVCAEPDGAECQSGTNPNLLSHKCAAVKRFHAGEGDGPKLVTITVAPVD